MEFYPKQTMPDEQIKFAVIAARYNNKWILCRHAERTTWELPGGHRESGETPIETARRELYEETGAVDADIHVVGVYRLYDYGLLCFAQVHKLDAIPAFSEICETRLFETLPQELTYGAVHAQLYDWVQGWLNMQNGAGELWDVYDKDRNLTGRLHRRGDYLPEGDYHLTVHVWMLNSLGEFLLTKRSPNKGFPNMWESTGGSALAGDDSLTAALREVREETGLTLQPNSGACLIRKRHDDHFTDVWLFRQDFSLDDVVLLEGETCAVMYADRAKLLELNKDGLLVPYTYLDQLLDMVF